MVAMQQRRKNNRTTASYQGIKCLERMSYVQTSGIEAFSKEERTTGQQHRIKA